MGGTSSFRMAGPRHPLRGDQIPRCIIDGVSHYTDHTLDHSEWSSTSKGGRVTQLADSTLAGLLDAAPDAMLTINEAGRIVLVNAQAERLLLEVDADRERLEAQLHQSQRLESLG